MSDDDLGSALLLAVPAAEPAVGRHRDRFDSSAPLGVPPHITVLFPFIPPAAIGPQVLARLTSLFAAVAPFVLTLDRTGWFGDHLLWLGPRDPAPLRALTRLAVDAFPGYSPYGGRHEEVIPHLTVGDTGSAQELRAAEAAIRPHLPIEAPAADVILMTGSLTAPRSWTTLAAFPLSNTPTPHR